MIKIRKARPADAAAIAGFQAKMACETEGLKLDARAVGRAVRAVFKDKSKGQYWAAIEEGRLLGSMLVIPEWSDWRNGWVLWLHSLYVVPEARRRGIFGLLYANLKKSVKSSPRLKGIRLFVAKRNTRAKKAYEAAGMTMDHYDLYEWLK